MERHEGRCAHTDGAAEPGVLSKAPLREKEIAVGGERYQTPDSVLAGWPEQVNGLMEQIYADFNKKHGTDYEFQLKK